ncbi:unnamed protein product, partial [Phaeothamnion confervicola]
MQSVHICEGASVGETVTLGEGCIIHPKSKIYSADGAGPITLGPGCVVEELVQIVNELEEPMNVGSSNLF